MGNEIKEYCSLYFFVGLKTADPIEGLRHVRAIVQRYFRAVASRHVNHFGESLENYRSEKQIIRLKIPKFNVRHGRFGPKHFP